MKTLRLTFALVAAVATSACSDSVAPDDAPAPAPAYSVAAEKSIGASLVQRVRLSTNQPARGDTLVIRSVVKNQGSAPATVEHVVCGFDYADDNILHQPFIMCAAYSMRSTIAPGDSIMHEDRRVVAARPGTHTIRFAHVVNPKIDVSVPILVK